MRCKTYLVSNADLMWMYDAQSYTSACLRGRVAKGIDLPANARNHAKLLDQKFVPTGGLVNHGNVVRGGLEHKNLYCGN